MTHPLIQVAPMMDWTENNKKSFQIN